MQICKAALIHSPVALRQKLLTPGLRSSPEVQPQDARASYPATGDFVPPKVREMQSGARARPALVLNSTAQKALEGREGSQPSGEDLTLPPGLGGVTSHAFDSMGGNPTRCSEKRHDRSRPCSAAGYRGERRPGPASLAFWPRPSFLRPGPRGGLTITTRDSLCTDGSPQPPPQQLSSKGAAILPGPTFATPEVLRRSVSGTVKHGAGKREGRVLLGCEEMRQQVEGLKALLASDRRDG